MASAALKNVVELLRSRQRDGNASLEEQRADLERLSERAEEDVACQPVAAGAVPSEWVVAPGVQSERAILYLHGGGYMMGSPHSHRALAARLGRAAQARVLLPDYRLSPEYPFPAAVEDAAGAYRWLLSRGLEPGKIVIAGDSAGGGLTLATLLFLRDAGVLMPAAAMAMSPWTDLNVAGESTKTGSTVKPMSRTEQLAIEPTRSELQMMSRYYIGDEDPRNPLISPVYGDYRSIPPLLIQVGEVEALLEDSIRVAQRARQASVKVELEVWPEMFHVWQVFAKILPEGKQAISRLGEFALLHTP